METNLLKQLSKRVWYMPANHETDRPVLGAVIGDEHTLIIDAGNSPSHAELFLNSLESLGASGSKLLVITHWHWDHIFGMKKMNLPAISHAKTKNYIERLRGMEWSDDALDERVRSGEEIQFCADMIKKEFGDRRHEIEIVPPVITFENSLSIDLGGVYVRLKHVGGDHADDSVVVFIEEDGILFLGDCYSPNIYAKKRNYQMPVLLNLLDELEGFHATTYLHSHGEPESQESFFKELREIRVIADAASSHKGDRKAILSAITAGLGRVPNDDEVEFAGYFE